MSCFCSDLNLINYVFMYEDDFQDNFKWDSKDNLIKRIYA